ncbi:MAG: ATP-binding cassette domain-containing protein [Clostridiales bacterium]|nr:ATP-binding cassette domain-containing protein [Clostridiales bacterium]
MSDHVRLEGINKTFGGFKASDGVSFSIKEGDLAGLLGPSGSGKTTILRMIAGLERPDSGDIYIADKRVNDIPAGKRGIGFVFQNYALFRYMTVGDNIAFGLEIQKKSKAFIKERVERLTKITGLDGLLSRFPEELSGGQKQRVAFARAIAPEPRLLLLDEPFAAIDAKVRKELRTWLRNTISELGITCVFVTHDQEEAVEVADNIIVTNRGKVEQSGPPSAVYQNPATPFAAEFIGQSEVITEYERLRGFPKISGFQSAVIRPEFIEIRKVGREERPNASQSGVAENIYFRGDRLEIDLLIAGMRVTAKYSMDAESLSPGETVSVVVNRLLLLGEKTVTAQENSLLNDANPIYI